MYRGNYRCLIANSVELPSQSKRVRTRVVLLRITFELIPYIYKSMNFLTSPVELNRIIAVLLDGWLWHRIILEG